MTDDIAFTNNLQIKENSNVSNFVLSGTDNFKNDELTDFVDKLIKENCSMKKELIIKELEIEKLKEMLKNASIKYFSNLFTLWCINSQFRNVRKRIRLLQRTF